MRQFVQGLYYKYQGQKRKRNGEYYKCVFAGEHAAVLNCYIKERPDAIDQIMVRQEGPTKYVVCRQYNDKTSVVNYINNLIYGIQEEITSNIIKNQALASDITVLKKRIEDITNEGNNNVE